MNSMQQLNRKNANVDRQLPNRVLQFGGGNFLRAFVDFIVQELNDTTDFTGGVIVVKPTARDDYSELKEQEGLFHVVLDGIKNGSFSSEQQLVSVVQKVIHCYNEWEAFLQTATLPEMRFVISNTTEAGIRFNDTDTFEEAPPKEFPAKLTRWLWHRFEHFDGSPNHGCVLLPCELIENNGAALKETVMQYAAHWQLSTEFKNWIENHNHFCGTLVDRIVSGYPQERSDDLLKSIGFDDKLLVAGEHYHSWVIQANEQVQAELPFQKTDLNVQFVDDLAPYREMKVRILNGAHTAMVPVGHLAGHRFVEEVMKDGLLTDYIKALLLDEVATTLDFTNEAIEKFVADVLDRFRNPILKHQLISIALNSTSKFVARLLPTLKDYLAKHGRLPKRIVFALAALLRFYKGGQGGEPIALNDNATALSAMKDAWETHEGSLPDLVKTILGNTAIWGENLNQIDGLSTLTAQYLEEIYNHGMYSALSSILKNKSHADQES